MFIQIPGFPMYLVDEHGTVVSMQGGKWRIMKSGDNSKGYLIVTLYEGGKCRSNYLHRIVARAWLGPANGLDVNHKNGIKTDNNLSNLEYCTRSENLQHAHDTGLINNTGERNGTAKLSDMEAARLLSAKGKMLLREAASEFGVSGALVSKIWNGKLRKHLHNPA